MAKATYRDAGVDLDVYRQSMARLPKLLGRTFSPRVLPLEGGFAGLFRLDFANRLFARNYDDPVLVSCSDGVGTKLKVACMTGRHATVGIDLVAMSVNDALCCGAEPLFFLDYVAMPKDDPTLLEQIVQGVSDGCIEADCALLGGETAILPDLYAPAITIWRASASASSREARSSTVVPWCPGTPSWALPPVGCIPTATASHGKSPSTLPDTRLTTASRNLAERSLAQGSLAPRWARRC